MFYNIFIGGYFMKHIEKEMVYYPYSRAKSVIKSDGCLVFTSATTEFIIRGFEMYARYWVNDIENDIILDTVESYQVRTKFGWIPIND